jgi:hypothetical protein
MKLLPQNIKVPTYAFPRPPLYYSGVTLSIIHPFTATSIKRSVVFWPRQFRVATLCCFRIFMLQCVSACILTQLELLQCPQKTNDEHAIGYQLGDASRQSEPRGDLLLASNFQRSQHITIEA